MEFGDNEYKALMKSLFNYDWKNLKKQIKQKIKPYKNWNGVDEMEMGTEQPTGQDESLYNFKISFEMMYYKDEEIWNRY